MITLGDIFEKPKVELFNSLPNSRFYNNSREREKEIKKTISQALRAFNVHVLQFDKNKNQLPKWKKETNKLNLRTTWGFCYARQKQSSLNPF